MGNRHAVGYDQAYTADDDMLVRNGAVHLFWSLHLLWRHAICQYIMLFVILYNHSETTGYVYCVLCMHCTCYAC